MIFPPWPKIWMGQRFIHFYKSHFQRPSVMASYLMLIAFFFVVINLIVDMLYVVVDPRIRIEGTEA